VPSDLPQLWKGLYDGELTKLRKTQLIRPNNETLKRRNSFFKEVPQAQCGTPFGDANNRREKRKERMFNSSEIEYLRIFD